MDIASLAIKVDSSEAGKAATDLEKLNTAGKKTNYTVEQAERYMRKASVVLGDMAKAEREASQGADNLEKKLRGASAAASDMANEAMRAAERTRDIGKMSGAAAFASRNLSYQLADVVQGFATGQKPMQIFAQQGFQIADALAQLRAEAKKTDQSLVGMIAGSLGRFGPLLVAAAVAAGSVSLALAAMQEDINESSEEAVSFGDVALGVFDGVRAYLQDKLGPAFEWVANVAGKAWEYILDSARNSFNLVVTIATASTNYIIAAFRTLPQAIAEFFVNAANAAIKAIEDLINKAAAGLNKFTGMVGDLLGKDFGSVGGVSFGRIENNFAGAGKRFGAAMADATAATFRDHFSDAVSYFKPFIAARAAKNVTDEAEKVGKSAGKSAGKAAGQAAGEEMLPAWAQALLDGLPQVIDELQAELNRSLAGVLGNDGFEGLREQIAIDQQLRINTRETERLEKEWARWNAQLRDTVSLLDQMGRSGQALGDIGAILVGLTSGDFSGARGPAGVLATQLFTTFDDKGERVLNKFAKDLTKSLDDVFGNFAQAMSGILGGVGVAGGVYGAGRALGLGKTASGALAGGAGAIGVGALASSGALGFGGAQAFLSTAGGPVGIAAAAIIGGLLASGVLSGHPKGFANLSGSTFTTGGNAARADQAGDLAGQVVNSLQQIADALGAEVGRFTGTIGIRGDKIRYNPAGGGKSSLKSGLDFGQDSAAAIKAAIEDAISDGVFEGLSDGVERLLKGEGDIEAQLAKALSFAGVFSELEQLKDPQGAALKELDKWRDGMGEIFAEAGASTEEYAKLEELTALKRKDILEQFGNDVTQLEQDRVNLQIQILALEGKHAEALAMSRKMELDAMDASLRPLQERIYALQDDAAATAESVRRYAYERAIRAEILDLQGNTAAAEKMRLEDALRAAEEWQRPWILARDAAQKAAAAERELAEARKAVTDEIDGLNRQWLQTIGDTAKLREMDLAALKSDEAREIQQRIWDYNDALAAQVAAQEAAEAAAKAFADRVSSLRDELASAYQRESSALQQTIDKFKGFADTIREFREGLFTGQGPAATFAQTQARFNSTANLAQTGNAGALQSFTGDAQAYLDAARDQAGSFAEYQRIVSQVANAARRAEQGASGVAGRASTQLGALQEMVSQFIDLNEKQTAVVDIVTKLEALEREQLVPAITDTIGTGLSELKTELQKTGAETRQVAAQAQSVNEQSVILLSRIERTLSNASRGDALAVTNDNSDPIYTTAAV